MTIKPTDLAERIFHGDQSAEQELFLDFGDKIAFIVQTRLGINNQDLEDICSEIKTAILIKLREGIYKPDKGSLSAYIYGIALNKIKDYYKSEKKRKNLFHSQIQEEIPIPDEDKTELEKQELQFIMRTIISSLKKKYKEVIYLRYYEGLSIPEIADQLQIEPRRVSERIHYAIKLLQKKCLKEKSSQYFTFNC
jgi:RNA polymerase sigma-70 factor, ECF subfamily